MKTPLSIETLVPVYQSTARHIPEYREPAFISFGMGLSFHQTKRFTPLANWLKVITTNLQIRQS
jgi:hypothetical protein